MQHETINKPVCFLLTCLLLCSVFMLPAGAQEQPDQASLLQVFKEYLDAEGIKYTDPSMPEVETVSVTFQTYSEGWTIFLGFYGPIMPMPTSDRIGKYVFYSVNWYEPYQIGLYAEKDGTVLTLKEAYEAGEIDIACVVNDGTFNAYLAGDANTDGVVNVSDVLMVQKVIANEIDGSIGSFDSYARLCDYNGDGEITVKDVLTLQKYVAKVA